MRDGFPVATTPAPGLHGVDWENRVDFDRLRDYRLARLREQLETSDLGGGPGTGATMKLAVNALVHGLGVALSESLVLAERAGVERSTAYEVFASGAAAPVRPLQARRLRAP